MNFNQLANTISESVNPIKTEEVEGARGRAPNPEIAKLVAQGMPYWKARAMVRKGLTNTAPADQSAAPEPVAPEEAPTDAPVDALATEPAAGGDEQSKEWLKTQAAVEDFLGSNPEATPEQVVQHLIDLNSGPNPIETLYITSPEKVERMMSASKALDSELNAPEAEEPPAEALPAASTEIANKYDKVRAFFKKYPTYDARKKVLSALDKKAAAIEQPDEEDDEKEPEVDPYVSRYVTGMKRRDAEEEEPEVDVDED